VISCHLRNEVDSGIIKDGDIREDRYGHIMRLRVSGGNSVSGEEKGKGNG